MPNVTVTEVLREPLDFRFHLIGAALRNEFGQDYTGWKFTETEGYDPDSAVWENNKDVVEDHLVSILHMPYQGPDRDI